MCRYKYFILLVLMIFFCWKDVKAQTRDVISLCGEWNYQLYNVGDTIPEKGILTLPGTLDTNGIGLPVAPSANTSQLSRRVRYTGDVTYSRIVEIPESWKDCHVELFLERTRPSMVKVDGRTSGFSHRISSPQRYTLSQQLNPGKHLLEITVNNGDSIPLAVRNNSHACTESTQTNWNGIIGAIELRAVPKFHISTVKILSDTTVLKMRIRLSSPASDVYMLSAKCGDKEGKAKLEKNDSVAIISVDLSSLGKWSEWVPELLNVKITLSDIQGKKEDCISLQTGQRRFEATSNGFRINGDLVFLRGRHDACVFPLTAHAPMDIETWRKYFSTIKSYGLNHVRFHSWCPPEACFKAADEAGIYLQPELSIWGSIDSKSGELLSFLEEDLKGIMESYSNHPSFTMFAVGNELWGEISLIKTLIDEARELNPNILATYGSNIYLGVKGHIEGEDYLVTCRVGEGDGFTTHARASFSFADADKGGLLNSTYPNSRMNFSKAVSLSTVPVVGHETGQFQIYPDFSTIGKYTGVLRPDNLKEFERRARKAGTIDRNRKYVEASGKWAAKLYKADMEMNLRTRGMGGFQLLDIQDYPGQGTALVGILDPFMDSKNVVSQEVWRQSCDEVVILAEFPKFCFYAGESVNIPVKVSNFSNVDMEGKEITWKFPFAEGTIKLPHGKGLLEVGMISLQLPESDRPQHMTLTLSLAETTQNQYEIWVYPRKKKAVNKVLVTNDFQQALKVLKKGGRVVLYPDSSMMSKAQVGPLFQTDYWNYSMFLSICQTLDRTPSPGTLGLLVDNTHPSLDKFPTSCHTDWQWFPIASKSYPLIIDELPANVKPVVEVIDNAERAHRLALMLECNVGKGRLMIVSADLSAANEHPESEWFVQSVKEYMASKDFRTSFNLTPAELMELLNGEYVSAPEIRGARNESYDH